MGLTERLANLNTPTVIITVIVLLLLRYVLIKQKSQAAKSVAEIVESLAVAMALVFLIIRPFIVQAFYIPSASMRPTLIERDHILVNKFIYRFTDPERGDVVVFEAPPEASSEERDFIKRIVALPGDTIRISPGYVLVGGQQYDHDDLQRALAPGNLEAFVKLTDEGVYVDGLRVTKAEIAAAIGDPEAEVKVVPGKVYLNGKVLNEPYVAEDPDEPYPNSETPAKWIYVNKNGKRVVRIPEGKLLVMGDNRNDSNDARYWGLLDRDRLMGEAMFIFWPLDRIRWIE